MFATPEVPRILDAYMTLPQPAHPLATQAPPEPSTWWVVCLCAAWCSTCTDYRTAFEAVARDWPAMRFVWVDIEDEAEVIGDVDVETFPTLLVADGRAARFFGPLLPQAVVLTRLIASLHAAQGGSAMAAAEDQALFERVRAARCP